MGTSQFPKLPVAINAADDNAAAQWKALMMLAAESDVIEHQGPSERSASGCQRGKERTHWQGHAFRHPSVVKIGMHSMPARYSPFSMLPTHGFAVQHACEMGAALVLRSVATSEHRRSMQNKCKPRRPPPIVFHILPMRCWAHLCRCGAARVITIIVHRSAGCASAYVRDVTQRSQRSSKPTPICQTHGMTCCIPATPDRANCHKEARANTHTMLRNAWALCTGPSARPTTPAEKRARARAAKPTRLRRG